MNCAKREEDGDKSVKEEEDAVGETFAGIKSYANITKLWRELFM